MKVLVTGGAGFIGSHVVDLLIQSGYEPIVVDNLMSGKRDNVPPNVRFIDVDISSPQLEDIFAKEKPDVVIHLAAQVDVAYSIQNPVEDATQNILGTIRLLTCCHKYNVKKFIFSSSCAVYGEKDDCSIKETFPILPQSFYGISKYTSEMYIQIFNILHNVPFTILRYANVYGPRQSSKGEGGVISIFFKKVLNGESPFIYGDGEQTRDFVYVKDVALANVLAIEKGTNEIFNIGCNSKTSINELYQMTTSLASLNIPSISMPVRKGDIRYSRLDNTKAINLLSWNPVYELQAGLNETLKYYKSS
ncbi:NAD-dependent epimerase/dehydratase family protein [Neobacillus drentensis]|uniref:NAD-dependent epimerase/dehydratase family protein n=1 Tax=Neobacillus drentensis TaxID=220684 RepID=UPI0028543D04|nr:NAD-dependent epimerase/dehydratase family protein [Neobacillus drentensis]MDR7240106.1 UDP-glucose 4-epimerase [Neobacillus drentensis]